LVHGFESTAEDEFAYQAALESYVKNAAAKSEDGGYQIRRFRFHTCDVLSGGEATFRETEMKLISKLLRLESKLDNFGQTGADDQSDQVTPPSFIFIAHGVASWLLKRVLATETGRKLARNAPRLIFLDAPKVSKVSTVADYEEAVERLFKRFPIRPGGKTIDRIRLLATSFKETDDTFRKYQGGYLEPDFLNVGLTPELIKVSA
jgi:hypothetical protein